MKVLGGCISVTFAIITLFGSVISAPANQSNIVAEKVAHIKSLISNAVGRIEAAANGENDEIRKVLMSKVQTAASQTGVLLENMAHKTKENQLNIGSALEILMKLGNILLDLQSQLDEDLSKLSPKVRNEVKEIFQTEQPIFVKEIGDLWSLFYDN